MSTPGPHLDDLQRRADARAEKRASLLAAAERTLARVGHQGLRMEQIAKEAEVSKGTLYLYFPGKDALFAAVAERHISRELPAIRDHVDAAPTGLAAVARILEAHGATFRADPARLRFMIEWLMNSDSLEDDSDEFRAYRQRVTEMLRVGIRALERGRGDGSVRAEVDPVHHALQLWHASLGLLLFDLNAAGFAKRTAIPYDVARVRAAHVDMQLRGLATSEAAIVAALADLGASSTEESRNDAA